VSQIFSLPEARRKEGADADVAILRVSAVKQIAFLDLWIRNEAKIRNRAALCPVQIGDAP
jgi:hypothetical protein